MFDSLDAESGSMLANMSSKRRKLKGQMGTMKMNQHTNGMFSVSLNVHRGRVTQKVFGPMIDKSDMALELFRSGFSAARKGADLVE